MLEQKSELNNLCPSLEEVRQKRLVFFSSMQQQEPIKTASKDTSMPLLTSEVPQTSDGCNLPNSSDGYCFPQSDTSNERSIPQTNTSNDHSFSQPNANNNHSCRQTNTSNVHFFHQSNASNDHRFPLTNAGNDHRFPLTNASNDHSFPQTNTTNVHSFPQTNTSNVHHFHQSNASNDHSFPHTNASNDYSFPQTNAGNDYSFLHSHFNNDYSFLQSNAINDQHFPQRKELFPSNELLTNERFPNKSSKTVKSTEESSINNHQVVKKGRLKMKESSPLTSKLDNTQMGLLSGQTHYNVHRSSTHHPELQTAKDQKDAGEEHSPNPQRQGKDIEGIFSDKIRGEIREALGEQGLQDVMLKTASDLQRGRSVHQHKAEVLNGDADTVSEFITQDGESSRSSSEHSSDVRNTQHLPKKSSCRARGDRNQSHCSRPGITTKYIQQLKEEEKEMNTLVRNYEQITAPVNTKHSFSAKEIYRQAFGDHPQQSEKQYYGHTYPEPWGSHNKQEKQDQSKLLDGTSYSKRKVSFDSAASIPPNITSASHTNLFTYPPPLLPFQTQLNMVAPVSPTSPLSPRDQYIPQYGTYPFQNYWYRSSSSELPPQNSLDKNQAYMFYQSSLPSNPSAAGIQSCLPSKPSAAFQQFSAPSSPSVPNFQQSNLPSSPSIANFQQSSLPSDSIPTTYQSYLPLKPSAAFQKSSLLFSPSIATVQQSSLPSSPSNVTFQQCISLPPDPFPTIFQYYLPFKPPAAFQPSSLPSSPSAASFQSYLPSNLLAAFQQSLSSNRYLPATSTTANGVPLFRNGIPLHLPPPPISERPQLPSTNQQHQKPQPASTIRTESLFQAGVGRPQVTQEPVMGGQHTRAPHPPSVPPPLQLKDESHDPSHRRLDLGQLGQIDAAARHLPHEDSKTFNLQRYFSSLEMYNGRPGSVEEILADSNQSVENVLFENRDSAESAFTGTSTLNAGGVTQRLKDLDIDLDQLKHLRVVDTKEDQSTTQAHFEVLSKGVRSCPECGSSNKAYMNWCTDCGELLIGIELTYPKRRNRQGSSKKNKRTLSSDVTHEEKSFMHENEIHDLKPMENTEYGNSENPREELPESGRGLSIADSPIQHQLEQNNCKDPKDSGRESSGAKEDTKLTRTNENYEDKNSNECLTNGENKEQGCDVVSGGDNDVFDGDNDGQVSFLEEVKDPILREFVRSYKQHQQSKLPDQNSSTVSKKTTVKPQTTDNNVAAADAESCFAFVTKERHALNADHSFTSRSSEEPRSAFHDTVLSSRTITLPKESKIINERKDSRSLNKYPAVQTTEDNVRVSTNQQMDSGNNNMQGQMSRPRKKKKKTRVEAMDVEIFGYEEIRKSRNQATDRVMVPALNLTCSSDEEEADDEEEEVEDEMTNNDSAVGKHNASGTVPGSSSLSEPVAYNRNQSKGDERVMNIIRSAQKQSMKTVPPPKPSLGKSEVPSYHSSRGNVRLPANYQRHWARSSTAWSSYNPRELNTSSSLKSSLTQMVPWRGGSRTQVRKHNIRDTGSQQEAVGQHVSSRAPVRQRSSSADYKQRKPACESHQRPSSATVRFHNDGLQVQPPATAPRSGFANARHNRYTTAASGQRETTVSGKSRPTSARTPNLQESPSPAAEASHQPGLTDRKEVNSDSDNESPRLLCEMFHRLAQKDEDENSDRLHAVARTAYDKLQEMTPRITEGQLSLWQCLPDEIWLYIFNFLSRADLKNLLFTSRYFNRLANDETLWKYITVKPRFAMTDASLAAVAHHRPLSLAMVKCQGHNLTPDGLHYFFKETRDRLKELNICGCSQGSLVGSIIMKVASEYCQKLTHLDASYCHVSDEAFTAISDCAERLESVCLNGFQSMSDSSLLTLLKKHGQSLRTLELYACFSLSASAFLSIGEYCTDLRRLCLGSCNKLTDATMITLSVNLAHIEELDLRGCKNLRNDCVRKIVHNCPRIRTLVLANCHQISDIALAEIATYLKNTLRVLDMCGCNNVTDNGVVSLAKNCDHLTSLDISSTRCTSVSVQNLAESSCNRWLETVRLSFLSGLTETCLLNLIHQCPRLRSVHVFGCPSLKTLVKLQSANAKLSIEGDSYVSRSILS